MEIGISRPARRHEYIDDSRVIHPPRGIVLHDPESSSIAGLLATYDQTGLLPHYSIDRDGTVYVHLDPDDGRTFHVRAADRWRPSWLTPNPDNLLVSDVNRQCIGIEILSGPVFRQQGVPYTDAQYESVMRMVMTLFDRYGRLPLVGHGSLQLDRTDPVAWDWERFWRMMTPSNEDKLGLVTADRDLCNRIKFRFEDWLRQHEGKRVKVPVGLADRLIAQARDDL